MSLLDLGFRYRGVVYRGHNPRWHHAPESGEGASRHGGRWNRISQAALYTSERFETAWLEAQQGFPFKTQPLTLCTYEVDCGPLLDLCDATIRDRVRPSSHLWMHENWLSKQLRGQAVVTQQIAQQLIELGFAGIRVPSQVKGATQWDINIVFWQWSRSAPRMVRVIDDEGRLY